MVGAVEDITDDPYNVAAVNLTDFTNFGPTDDGRVKPDVVANGQNLLSPEEASNTDYGVKSGTSMAAPNVTGTAALLYEHYDNLFSATPRSATMKGLLIHTAADAGLRGPDYSHGWGVVDGEAAANFLSEASLLNNVSDPIPQKDSVLLEGTYTGSTLNFNLDVLDVDEPIKVTLVWTDPAGTPHGNALDETTPVLVNDLDLSITAPDGTTFNPWTLDGSNPDDPAVRTQRNEVDNVEQVLIDPQQVQDGQYTITLDDTGGLFNDQPQNFSLLVSSNSNSSVLPANVTGEITGSDPSYCCTTEDEKFYFDELTGLSAAGSSNFSFSGDEFAAGTSVEITLASSLFDPTLFLFNADSKEIIEVGYDPSSSTQAQITIDPLAGINYLLSVETADPNQFGTYEVSFQETV